MQVPFTRTVRDISCSFSGLTKSGDPKLMWHIDALDALHEAAETYLVEMFEVTQFAVELFSLSLTPLCCRTPTRARNTPGV